LFWCSCGFLLGEKNQNYEVLKKNFKKIFKLEWNEYLNGKFRILYEEAHHYYVISWSGYGNQKIRSKCTGNTALMRKTRKLDSIFVRTRLANRSSGRWRKIQGNRLSGWELNDAGTSGFDICGISQKNYTTYIYATELYE
jgi:hypothetical protein